jgi:hypothetical protein
MTEEKQLLKKITNLFEESKKRKIIDYDGGMLQDIFEPITGNAEEKFDRWSDRLIRVAARLENLYMNKDDKPEVLNDIYTFFDGLKLPYISSEVKDDSVTIKYGRTIQIRREDNNQITTCPVEIFNDIAQTIRHEQYMPLIAEIKRLFTRAVAVLQQTEFSWHRNDLIEEINPQMEENNGGTGKPESDTAVSS